MNTFRTNNLNGTLVTDQVMAYPAEGDQKPRFTRRMIIHAEIDGKIVAIQTGAIPEGMYGHEVPAEDGSLLILAPKQPRPSQGREPATAYLMRNRNSEGTPMFRLQGAWDVVELVDRDTGLPVVNNGVPVYKASTVTGSLKFIGRQKRNDGVKTGFDMANLTANAAKPASRNFGPVTVSRSRPVSVSRPIGANVGAAIQNAQPAAPAVPDEVAEAAELPLPDAEA